MLTTNASGEFDAVCLPTLETSVWSPRASIVGGEVVRYADLSVTAADHPPVTGGGAYGFDCAALAQHYSRLRIVGWGARMRGIAGLNTTGEVISSVAALKGLAPFRDSSGPAMYNVSGNPIFAPSYYGGVNFRDTAQMYFESLGLPWKGVNNGAVLDIDKIPAMQNHATATSAEAAARGLHFRSYPFEPDAHRFRAVSLRTTGTDVLDYHMGGGQTVGQDASAWKVEGWESIILGGTGFPASTNVATLEVIYHVEATVNPNLTTLARSTSQASPVAPLDHQKTLAALAHTPRISYADVVKRGGDLLLGAIEGAASDAATRGLESLAGMLTRQLALGL